MQPLRVHAQLRGQRGCFPDCTRAGMPRAACYQGNAYARAHLRWKSNLSQLRTRYSFQASVAAFPLRALRHSPRSARAPPADRSPRTIHSA
eukprot:2033958-Pyramimonas_sp.AAC.1